MSPGKSSSNLSLIIASQGDVEKIAWTLGYHLSPAIRAAFKDKVERYTRKNDRDVIIARIDENIVGYCMVIERMEPPDSLSPEVCQRLSGYGCLTGLGVNLEWRKNRIGASLVEEGFYWMKQRCRPGIWLRTRAMAEWYEKHFQFDIVGSMTVKQTVIKAVLAKSL